jgi:hypothetical protein
MIKATMTINLSLIGPIMTQSSAPGDWGLDLVAARNADGKFYLPGTLLAGRLSQAWQELQDAVSGEHWFAPKIEKWLGECSENDFPKTKQLFFSDLTYQGEHQTATHNRIKIDEKRGSVDKHQMVLIESPFLTGEDYKFTGALHFFAADETEAESIIRHVNAGLNWTAQLGAMRSVGFGRIKKVENTKTIDELPETDPQTPIPAENIVLSIRPLYPFCVTGKPVADNLFESLAIIPGGAILGAIATTWNQLCQRSGGQVDDGLADDKRPMLKKYFSHIRISHALPSEQPGVRPITLPLSLVKVPGEKTLHDVMLLDGPCLINDKAPEFAVDWKDDDNTVFGYGWPYLHRKEYGWPTVIRELRTRTAINPDTLRSADNQLFSYEQIAPGALTWNAQLDLSRIPEGDRNAVYGQLQSLLSCGIAALSKTKTPASIEWTSPSTPAVQKSDSKPLNGNQWIVTLQTDALLGAPTGLDESSGHGGLHKMYAQAWQDLSSNKLQLVRYFARQRLSGGNYRRSIFQVGNKDYHPWLLTEAGSVFLLQTSEDTNKEDGEALIKQWLSQGLPLKGAVLDYYAINPDIAKQWQNCPFVAQNGYGEIAVNLQLHTQLKPEHITPINSL